MNRRRWYVAASIGALLAACGAPTDACGCTPSRSAVIVLGLLQDRDGRPMPNVRIGLEGIPRNSPHRDTLPVRGWEVTHTKSDGTFRVVVFSIYSPDTLKLRLALMPGSTTEAPAFAETLARFRREGTQSDSIMRTFTVP